MVFVLQNNQEFRAKQGILYLKQLSLCTKIIDMNEKDYNELVI